MCIKQMYLALLFEQHLVYDMTLYPSAAVGMFFLMSLHKMP